MSRYPALVIALSAALITALIAEPTLTLRTGVTILFALLTGAALAYFFLKRDDQSNPMSLIANLQTADGDHGSGSIVTLGKLFEATMISMREGVLVVDQEMRVVASNLAARDVFTSAKGPLDSHYLTELTRNPSIYSAFLDAINGKERAEVKVEMPGPGRRIFDLRVMPLGPGDRKGAHGAIGVFFDITRLERLERVRQEFLSNVSHELRTPLTAILAFVETLEDGAVDDGANNRRFLSIIRKNATRMHTLIDDILELSAIEAGTVPVEPAPVPLYPVIASLLTALAAKAHARRVTLHNEVEGNVIVFADERRLEQMLTNLVENAIKFNREGGTVTIRHERTSDDQIYVEDTGEGIPEEHLSRLFERFYRVDKARSREMGGTGLGLAIVKHLARAHGGEVTVNSRLGEGSTFTVKLPVHKEESP